MASGARKRIQVLGHDGLGHIGRATASAGSQLRALAGHTAAMTHLLVQAVYYATVGPLTGRSKIRKQLGPMMANVGVRSLPIVALVSALIGAILVLQTGEVMQQYGQVQEVPGLVALSVTRELGPLLTGLIMTARVGASFTAVLAAMQLNEEVLALRTMAINPIGYLVSPRIASLVIMLPCLTMASYAMGIFGGAVVASFMYDIPPSTYLAGTVTSLGFADLATGMLKAVAFSFIIGTICCYYGMIARGGPMGLGRFTMVAVVTSMVVVVLADSILTAFAVSYLL